MYTSRLSPVYVAFWYVPCSCNVSTTATVSSRWRVPADKYQLFVPLQRLDSHLYEPVLGLAVGKAADGLDRLAGVVLGQRPCLFYPVALIYQIPCLFC